MTLEPQHTPASPTRDTSSNEGGDSPTEDESHSEMDASFHEPAGGFKAILSQWEESCVQSRTSTCVAATNTSNSDIHNNTNSSATAKRMSMFNPTSPKRTSVMTAANPKRTSMFVTGLAQRTAPPLTRGGETTAVVVETPIVAVVEIETEPETTTTTATTTATNNTASTPAYYVESNAPISPKKIINEINNSNKNGAIGNLPVERMKRFSGPLKPTKDATDNIAADITPVNHNSNTSFVGWNSKSSLMDSNSKSSLINSNSKFEFVIDCSDEGGGGDDDDGGGGGGDDDDSGGGGGGAMKVGMLSRRLNRLEARDTFPRRRRSGTEASMGGDTVSTCSFIKKALRQPRNMYQKPLSFNNPEKPYEHKRIEHDLDDQKLILKVLKKNFVFRERSTEELVEFVASFEKFPARRDTEFIKQGEPAEYFYILKSGAVKLVMDGEVIETVSGKGATLGELALLYTCPRTTSAIAAKDSRLFRVHSSAFRFLLRQQAQVTNEEKMSLLKNVPFLESLSETDLKRLASLMTPKPFDEGQVLLSKTGQKREFIIIKEGSACFKSGSTEAMKEKVFGPGDFFGERPTSRKEDMESDIVSTSKGIAFVVDHDAFEKVIGSMESLFRRDEDVDSLREIKFFKQARLDDTQLGSLANLISREQSFPKGKVILKSGTKVTPALYFVRRGLVEMETHSNGEKVQVGAGRYFGEELVTISESKSRLAVTCSITVTVIEPCVCSMLTLRDCRTVFDIDVSSPSLESSLDRISKNGKSAVFTMDQSVVVEDDETSKVTQTQASVVDQGATPNEVNGRPNLKRASTLSKLKKKTYLPKNPSGFEKHLVLGEGTFAQVWLVTCKKSDQDSKLRPFALKILSKHELITEGQAGAALREKNILQELKHPFIIRLYKTYQDDSFLYEVLEFVQGGELFSRMHTDMECQVTLPEAQAKFYALAIADALAYMHHPRHSIVYRDLKPENVMISHTGYPVIIDFGLAKKITDKTYTLCGTPG